MLGQAALPVGKHGHVTARRVDLSRPTPTLPDANLRYQDAPDWRIWTKGGLPLQVCPRSFEKAAMMAGPSPRSAAGGQRQLEYLRACPPGSVPPGPHPRASGYNPEPPRSKQPCLRCRRWRCHVCVRAMAMSQAAAGGTWGFVNFSLFAIFALLAIFDVAGDGDVTCVSPLHGRLAAAGGTGGGVRFLSRGYRRALRRRKRQPNHARSAAGGPGSRRSLLPCRRGPAAAAAAASAGTPPGTRRSGPPPLS